MRRLQPQLMLIQKTLLQIEGVGRQLYPDLDLWKTAATAAASVDSRTLEPAGTGARCAQAAAGHVAGVASIAAAGWRTRFNGRRTGACSVPVDITEIERLKQTIAEDGRRRDVTLVTAIGALSGVILIADRRRPGVARFTPCSEPASWACSRSVNNAAVI